MSCADETTRRFATVSVDVALTARPSRCHLSACFWSLTFLCASCCLYGKTAGESFLPKNAIVSPSRLLFVEKGLGSFVGWPQWVAVVATKRTGRTSCCCRSARESAAARCNWQHYDGCGMCAPLMYFAAPDDVIIVGKTGGHRVVRVAHNSFVGRRRSGRPQHGKGDVVVVS